MHKWLGALAHEEVFLAKLFWNHTCVHFGPPLCHFSPWWVVHPKISILPLVGRQTTNIIDEPIGLGFNWIIFGLWNCQWQDISI
jgi:hypothetical protein